MLLRILIRIVISAEPPSFFFFLVRGSSRGGVSHFKRAPTRNNTFSFSAERVHTPPSLEK